MFLFCLLTNSLGSNADDSDTCSTIEIISKTQLLETYKNQTIIATISTLMKKYIKDNCIADFESCKTTTDAYSILCLAFIHAMNNFAAPSVCDVFQKGLLKKNFVTTSTENMLRFKTVYTEYAKSALNAANSSSIDINIAAYVFSVIIAKQLSENAMQMVLDHQHTNDKNIVMLEIKTELIERNGNIKTQEMTLSNLPYAKCNRILEGENLQSTNSISRLKNLRPLLLNELSIKGYIIIRDNYVECYISNLLESLAKTFKTGDYNFQTIIEVILLESRNFALSEFFGSERYNCKKTLEKIKNGADGKKIYYVTREVFSELDAICYLLKGYRISDYDSLIIMEVVINAHKLLAFLSLLVVDKILTKTTTHDTLEIKDCIKNMRLERFEKLCETSSVGFKAYKKFADLETFFQYALCAAEPSKSFLKENKQFNKLEKENTRCRIHIIRNYGAF